MSVFLAFIHVSCVDPAALLLREYYAFKVVFYVLPSFRVQINR